MCVFVIHVLRYTHICIHVSAHCGGMPINARDWFTFCTSLCTNVFRELSSPKICGLYCVWGDYASTLLLGALSVLCYPVLWLQPPHNSKLNLNWNLALAGCGYTTGLSGPSWSNGAYSVGSPEWHWPSVSLWRFWALICEEMLPVGYNVCCSACVGVAEDPMVLLVRDAV